MRTEYNVELDPLIPYQLQDLSNAPECFGKEWNSKNATCLNCKGIDACGTYQVYTNQEKAVDIENGVPFLSKASFSNIDRHKFAMRIMFEPPFSYNDWVDVLSKESKLSDKVTLTMWLDELLKEYDLTVTNGMIHEKD